MFYSTRSQVEAIGVCFPKTAVDLPGVAVVRVL